MINFLDDFAKGISCKSQTCQKFASISQNILFKNFYCLFHIFWNKNLFKNKKDFLNINNNWNSIITDSNESLKLGDFYFLFEKIIKIENLESFDFVLLSHKEPWKLDYNSSITPQSSLNEGSSLLQTSSLLERYSIGLKNDENTVTDSEYSTIFKTQAHGLNNRNGCRNSILNNNENTKLDNKLKQSEILERLLDEEFQTSNISINKGILNNINFIEAEIKKHNQEIENFKNEMHKFTINRTNNIHNLTLNNNNIKLPPRILTKSASSSNNYLIKQQENNIRKCDSNNVCNINNMTARNANVNNFSNPKAYLLSSSLNNLSGQSNYNTNNGSYMENKALELISDSGIYGKTYLNANLNLNSRLNSDNNIQKIHFESSSNMLIPKRNSLSNNRFLQKADSDKLNLAIFNKQYYPNDDEKKLFENAFQQIFNDLD